MASGLSRRGFTFLLATCIAASACDRPPDPEFVDLERSLALTIEHAEFADARKSAQFTLKVHNRGVRVASACIGPSRTVLFDILGRGGVSSETLVHHPACVTEFEIAPGGDFVWSETLSTPHLSEHPDGVEVDVEIVNPRRCSSVGCPSFRVRSERFRIP